MMLRNALLAAETVVLLMLQRFRSVRKATVDFSVPTGTVFHQAGAVMVTLTVMMLQMKPAVVSILLAINLTLGSSVASFIDC